MYKMIDTIFIGIFAICIAIGNSARLNRELKLVCNYQKLVGVVIQMMVHSSDGVLCSC